ncbi:MAG: hypothetical protein AAF479_03865 [Pseudomonadota bacterium]
MKTIVRFGLIVVVVYVFAYVFFRLMNTEVWSEDDRPYVIYPKDNRLIYLLFRPASYADALLTGMGTHIGPHQEANQ